MELLPEERLRQRLEDKRTAVLAELPYSGKNANREFYRGQLAAITKIYEAWRLKVLKKIRHRIPYDQAPYCCGYTDVLNMAIRTLEEG